MTITLTLVLFSFVALLFLIRLAKGRVLTAADSNPGTLNPVDIRAFRNLLDPAETNFLRASLSPSRFKAVQRKRLRAAVAYVKGAANNAAVLADLGNAARRSPEPAIAEAGERLVDSAIRLRIFAARTIPRLYLGILLPGTQVSQSRVAESYERMNGLVFTLRNAQRSQRQISAVS